MGRGQRSGRKRVSRSSAPISAHEPGFTIVEVVVAMLLVAIITMGVAQLFAVAMAATENARHQTSTAALAAQKMEQLRSLTWAFAPGGTGVAVSDTTTDLSTDPPTSSGLGLSPSPTGTLAANTPGYVDYLNGRGQWVGTGASLPRGVVYIRRWSVESLAADRDTLLFQVIVTTARRDVQAMAMGGARRRLSDEALIATVRTRKSAVS